MTHVPFHLIYNDEMGITLLEDERGFRYFNPTNDIPRYDERVFFGTMTTDNWQNITQFHSIPNHFGGNVYYIVPSRKNYFITFLIATQSTVQKQYEPSHLGLFINGELRAFASFTTEMHYAFSFPIAVPEYTTVEWKFKPFDTSTKLSMTTGGYIKSY